MVCRVAIRCCPTQADPIIKIAGGEISLQRPKTTLTKKFKFNDIHLATAGTGDVHERSVAEHVRAAVRRGESVTVLSFGARATGKTTTLRSRDGVVLRAATDVFAGLGVGDKYMVTVSCLLSAVAPPAQSHLTGRQVTHEILLDGMLPQGEVGEYKGGLHVREHPTRGFFVDGLSEIAVDRLTECEEYLRRALANCAAEEERCGSAGAPLRVHCLINIRVRRKSEDGESVSDVQILDLAGWVRDKPASKGPGAAKAPAAVVGEDMVVKAFQRIVSSLEAKAGHIPYRDSKMTRLLQPALGGHALCIPLIHIAVDNYEETEAMLTFAQKMTSICSKVQPNLVDYGAELATKQSRIEALCRKLGRRPQGLKSSDIIMGMNSSDELLELREILCAIELQQRDGHEWAKADEASRAFKADGGASAIAVRADRKPKKDPRFKEITDDTDVTLESARAHKRLELQNERRVPPARGHGNNTPRGSMHDTNENDAGSETQQIPAASEAVGGGRGEEAVLQRRNRAEEAVQVPSKSSAGERVPAQHPVVPRGAGGGAVVQGDMDSMKARIAKMQQQKISVRVASVASKEGPAEGSHEPPPAAIMAERLAILKSKPLGSRLRSMS